MPIDSHTPNAWSRLKDEAATLEGKQQIARVRRQLIESGQVTPRSFSRNDYTDVDLRQEALDEIDAYLAEIGKTLEQKRQQLQAIASSEQQLTNAKGS